MAPDPFAEATPDSMLKPSTENRQQSIGASLSPSSFSSSSSPPPTSLTSSIKGTRAPMAATAPVLRCYEEAVQAPVIECSNYDSLYSQAQFDDSDRFHARVLREDFCSTAIIASTWLALDPRNRAQGVDIDLDALSHTHRRLGSEKVNLLQSPRFAKLAGSSIEGTRRIALQQGVTANGFADAALVDEVPAVVEPLTARSDTWAPGAATERFDRKLAKKLDKEAKKLSKRINGKRSEPGSSGETGASLEGQRRLPRLTLLHSDVLDLPLPLPSSDAASASDGMALEPPDILAAPNYALAYLHSRETLLSYLRMALRSLRPRTGVFINDMFGGPPDGDNYYPDQDEAWALFQDEAGFDMDSGGRPRPIVPAEDRAPEATAALGTQSVGIRTGRPRGKLKMVRTGVAYGGFEYWREDGPVDYATNRFKLTLRFRYSDGSWLRYASYDFRLWSLKELTEAMEEVGFVRVRIFALPEDAADEPDASGDCDGAISCPPSLKVDASEGTGGSGANGHGDERNDGLEGMADLMRRTEAAERNKTFYRALQKGEKLFADRSFGTYIVACAPR